MAQDRCSSRVRTSRTATPQPARRRRGAPAPPPSPAELPHPGWPKVTRPLGRYHPRRRSHPEPPPTFEASARTPPDYKPPVPGLQHDRQKTCTPASHRRRGRLPGARASARRSPQSVVSPCPRHEVKPSKHCSHCGSLRTCAGTTHSPQRQPPKKRRGPSRALSNGDSGGYLLSREVSLQVPSAWVGLTSLFGMGRGVSPPL